MSLSKVSQSYCISETKPKPVMMQSLQGGYDVILGKAWLDCHNPKIDWPSNTMRFFHKGARHVLSSSSPSRTVAPSSPTRVPLSPTRVPLSPTRVSVSEMKQATPAQQPQALTPPTLTPTTQNHTTSDTTSHPDSTHTHSTMSDIEHLTPDHHKTATANHTRRDTNHHHHHHTHFSCWFFFSASSM